MPTPSLKEFAQAIPVCDPTSGIANVLEIFRSSGSDTIVVLNEQQRPLGMVNLQQVIPFLLPTASLGETPVAIASGDFHKPLCELDPPLIEPLAILPEKLKLEQFWAYLQNSGERLTQEEQEQWGWENRKEESASMGVSSQSSSPSTQKWALVDGEGKFQGMLNSCSLLKSLASKLAATDGDAGTLEEPEPATLNFLVPLLEQLPLPLSIQTATGQVLAENLTWRTLIGTSPNLESIRFSPAPGLDAPEKQLPSTQSSSADGSSQKMRTWLENHAQPQDAATTSFRRLGEAQASRSPNPPINVTKQQHQPVPQAARERYCAIDTPRMAATVSQLRSLLADPMLLNFQDAPTTWEAFLPASEMPKNGIDRVFSFVKIPLPKSILKEGSLSYEMGGKSSTNSSQSSSSTTSNLWLVLAQDTTEQQQVAQELAAKNADLIQLNRLKDEFLACISHELKTPLTAVLGLSTLLKDQALGKLNERQARYAKLIYQSGRQLMAVVNDILDLTRMETGQMELTLEPVKIQAVCDRAYSQALQRPSETEQEDEESSLENKFTLEIEPGLESLVADELRLRQMLMHLLSNALKFTDEGGEIGLKVNRWEGWIAFTVWDTGIGIPTEQQHLIFQKFQQLEKPLTRRFEGTGLGLVLTQRLARLHGGDVSFISKIGEGSQFTLLLPPCPPQASEQAEDRGEIAQIPIPNPQCSIHNRLVLIVETVPRYLEGLTEKLRSFGYRVIIARSGTEAIEKARRFQPCAILLNPLLPQLSGWDVLTVLKSDEQTLHIPVLVTATQAEKQQAYHHKADGFLSLPVQEKALLHHLNSLCDRSSPTSSNLTILHLCPVLDETRFHSSILSSQFTEFLGVQHSELNYRVLEADDIEQAELLTRIWHPDLILLDTAEIPEPLEFLQELSLHNSLTSLPMVTLDRQTTEAANQLTGLTVYPCLTSDCTVKMPALLQVIQVAVGMSCKPSILVMDIGEPSTKPTDVIPQCPQPSLVAEEFSKTSTNPTSQASWLQAFIQYLETAGFRSLLSSSWTEVFRQLQEQSVDLLVIRLRDINNSSALVNEIISLTRLQTLPPILVLDHRLDSNSIKQTVAKSKASQVKQGKISTRNSNSGLDALLKNISSQVLQGYSQSMNELLDHIHQTIAQTRN